MNIICDTFGHKFVSVIITSKWYEINSYRMNLKEPMCKRCGLARSEIVSNIRKAKK